MVVAFELNGVGVWDMTLYVFEVRHGCAHLETVRHDLDEDMFEDPLLGWVGADRKEMMSIKAAAVRDLCPDCQLARDTGCLVTVLGEPEEDFSRVPDLLTRHWQTAAP